MMLPLPLLPNQILISKSFSYQPLQGEIYLIYGIHRTDISSV